MIMNLNDGKLYLLPYDIVDGFSKIADYAIIGTTDVPFDKTSDSGLRFVYPGIKFPNRIEVYYESEMIYDRNVSSNTIYVTLSYDYNNSKFVMGWLEKTNRSIDSSGTRCYRYFGDSADEFNELRRQYEQYTNKTNFYGIVTPNKRGVLIETYTKNTNDYNIFGYGFLGFVYPLERLSAEATQNILSKLEPDPVPSTDPYNGAGDSTIGGGGGSFDGSSDPIDIPSLPPVGATNTGFISLFVPSESQVRSVANYLWSSLFDVSTFFKIFENPMDCILGLSVVPVTVPTSGNAQITVGNIELSGITLPLASAQYVEVDCGTISFENKFFGSYLDYEPYTKMAIFLPYCGVHQINADDIMGKVIRVVYHVDILTGSCVAFVKCGDSVLYQFNGACATNIPITNISYNSTIENAIRIAVNIGTTVATAGASAPLSAGAETVGHTAQNIARGVSLAGSTAEGALSLKPSIGRSGALGGTTGILAGQKPYLIITRPRLCKPKNQDFYKGYPSFVQTTVGDLIGKGYTEFDTVIISTLYLTDNEEAELERILQGGVYL